MANSFYSKYLYLSFVGNESREDNEKNGFHHCLYGVPKLNGIQININRGIVGQEVDFREAKFRALHALGKMTITSVTEEENFMDASVQGSLYDSPEVKKLRTIEEIQDKEGITRYFRA